MRENKFYSELFETISEIRVVDTHEHLLPESMRIEGGADFFGVVMTHYASSDLISAGMSADDMEKLRGKDIPFEEKIKIFIPFWERASNTTYCRALEIAARDLYGADEINAGTLPEINRAMKEKCKLGFYKEILQDRCKIKYCLWDQFFYELPEKDDFLRLSLRLDDFVFVNGPEDIINLEKRFDTTISCPECLEELMEKRITEHKPRGLTALKSALAYSRTLDYRQVSHAEAVLSMERMLRGRFLESDAKNVQDFMMYSLAQKAFWHDLTLQMHTGLLEGNGNMIRNANPALLSQLVSANPGTRFDLFHGGYPYGGELASMAKMFPNVYLDMAWLHIISPSYAVCYTREWLETVPVCKLLGFGGDYLFVEGTYGHFQIAKENRAAALSEQVEAGAFGMREAKRYASMMLRENPEALFGNA